MNNVGLKYRLVLIMIVVGISTVFAQSLTTISSESKPTISDAINSSNRNTIIASDEILKLLDPEIGIISDVRGSTGKIIVYRVQVFSDNKAEASRKEAKAKERAIARRFPEYSTSVVYMTPYWRLLVGTFRTSAEADEFAIKLRKAFPAYAREIHVVRARGTLVK